MQTANELRTALVLAVAVLIAAAASAQVAQSARKSPPLPAAGVQQFERSAFCRKYLCSLDAIEPMRFGGEIREWCYNYRVFPPDPRDDTHEYTMQVGMRLARDGTRTSPYLIIRWYPIASAPEQEMQVASELIKEAIGTPDFAAGAC